MSKKKREKSQKPEGNRKSGMRYKKRGGRWLKIGFEKVTIGFLILLGFLGFLYFFLRMKTPYYKAYFSFYARLIFSAICIVFFSLLIKSLFEVIRETLKDAKLTRLQKTGYNMSDIFLVIFLIGIWGFYIGVLGKSILDLPRAVCLNPVVKQERLQEVKEYKVKTGSVFSYRLKIKTENLKFNIKKSKQSEFLLSLKDSGAAVVEVTYLPYTKKVIHIKEVSKP